VADTTTDRATAREGDIAKPQARGVRRWLVVPRSDAAVRLTLLGVVVALHNLLEIDRRPVRAALGAPLTGALVVAVLGGSLVLLLVALRPRLPSWRWPRSRRAQIVVLLLTLVALPIGLKQVGVMVAAGFQPPLYPNDGTTLDHYAAQQLLEHHNPYASADIVAAVRLYHQDAEHTTPLGQGAFAAHYPAHYPTAAELRSVFASEPAGQPSRAVEFESHVSYPALAFLPLVPLVWAGAPSVVPFFALCFFALVALLVVSVPAELRPWVGLLALADAPLLNATVAGDLDVFYILLLFVAWRWWRRPLLSALFLGLASAAKQIAWFFLPYYAILVWRERGPREALARLAGAGAIFAVINAPFFFNDPRAWLAGVLAPQVDRMFPLGNGLVQLSLSGLLPLAPEGVYTALEAIAIVACIAWYWRYGRGRPEIGFVLAVLPLFLAWRSLTTYFYFVALPAVALLLAREWSSGQRAAGAAGGGQERRGSIAMLGQTAVGPRTRRTPRRRR
jgi:Glycosyltransferase family 87